MDAVDDIESVNDSSILIRCDGRRLSWVLGIYKVKPGRSLGCSTRSRTLIRDDIVSTAHTKINQKRLSK